jgi:hypothetical protein
VTRLDERERRITLWVAAMGALASVVLWAPAFDQAAGLILAAVGVVLSGLLAAAARSGNRLLTCVAAVLLGFGPWGVAWILGLPYVILATWLLFRDRKASAERRAREAPRTGEQEPERKRRPRSRARARQPPARERPARPEASKRYTPPQRRQ